MKRLTVFFTIAILVCIATFVAFASNQNRDSSWAYLEVNTTYGSAYNPPTYTDKGCSGSDSEGPLWSTADSWVGYTDNGYTWKPIGNITWDYRYKPSGFFDHELQFVIIEHTGKKHLGKVWKGQWHYKNYDKIFGASAYSYISCNTSNDKYETSYNLYAEIPKGFDFPNIRNPDIQKEFGSFSDSEYRGGSVSGWDHEISTNPNSSASASGTNPSSGESHSTSAATPTAATARDFEIL